MSIAIKNASSGFIDSLVSNKRNKNKIKKNRNKKNFIENKENISNNINIKLYKEDDTSLKELKSNSKSEKLDDYPYKKQDIISIPVKPVNSNEHQKYAQKLKEKTMKMEIDRIYNETERLYQQYEGKNDNLHLYSNNPQYKKYIKKLEKQILSFIIAEIILNIYSTINYFKLTKENEGISLANYCLSNILIAITIIIFIILKLGLLNDPEISKAFRFFSILEFLILISFFTTCVISGYLNFFNIKKISKFFKMLIYFLLLFILFIFIARIKYGFNLFYESLLILIGKKTEYSVLILKEEKMYKDNYPEYNNIISSMSYEKLNKTSDDIFREINKNNKEIHKEEEKYKNYNYFYKFHSSVSTDYRI